MVLNRHILKQVVDPKNVYEKSLTFGAKIQKEASSAKVMLSFAKFNTCWSLNTKKSGLPTRLFNLKLDKWVF